MKIEYLSDKNPDYKALEEYIANGNLGPLHDLWSTTASNDIKNLTNSYKTKFNKIFSEDEINACIHELHSSLEIPTRYDSVWQHMLLRDLSKSIKDSINELKFENKKFPYIGTIPTGLVNACALKIPNTSNDFILIDSQLFTFCNLFAKAFSLCLPLGSSSTFLLDLDKIRKLTKKNTNGCITKIHDLLHNFCTNKCPSNARPYLPPLEYIPLVNIIRNGMELFIVGHEYGHFTSGHLDKCFKLAVIASPILQNRSKNHLQEFVADIHGCFLAINSQIKNGYDIALSFIGIDLFFSAMILSNRYASLILGVRDEHFEDEESETHPSFTDRQNFIRSLVFNHEAFSEHKESIEGLCSFYDKCIQIIWSEVMKKTNK